MVRLEVTTHSDAIVSKSVASLGHWGPLWGRCCLFAFQGSVQIAVLKLQCISNEGMDSLYIYIYEYIYIYKGI